MFANISPCMRSTRGRVQASGLLVYQFAENRPLNFTELNGCLLLRFGRYETSANRISTTKLQPQLDKGPKAEMDV